MSKLGGRVFASFLVAGLTGQFAWTIENMYLNVFLYNTIAQDPAYIAAMVAASAAVATLATLLMGALSDRLGRRKGMICAGYMLWGLSTMAFGVISPQGMARFGAQAAHAAAVAVIALDCVMTFFGSTANDAAFNAYVTDHTDGGNRGRVESVLATLPLLSMLVIFGGFDGMTQRGEWRAFFFLFGAVVTAAGVALLFLVRDAPLEKKREPYLSRLTHGFKPAVVRANGKLYLALCALCVYSVAVQVFFPYLIIYMQHYLRLDAYALVLGVVLLFASAVSVLMGRVIDRVGKLRFVTPAVLTMAAGLCGMYAARGMLAVMAAGAVMMSGYMLVTAALSASVRDYTPRDAAGLFQGIRMIFAVLVPMVIGPALGAAVIRSGAGTYTELGVVKSVPTPDIFLAAAAVLLLAFVPVHLLKRRERA